MGNRFGYRQPTGYPSEYLIEGDAHPGNDLLLEDGSFFLLEDGSGTILLES